MHGLTKKECLEIIPKVLREVQNEIDNGTCEPNMSDGKNHIFKIICGAGKHSKNGIGVNKQAINQYLKS